MSPDMISWVKTTLKVMNLSYIHITYECVDWQISQLASDPRMFTLRVGVDYHEGSLIKRAYHSRWCKETEGRHIAVKMKMEAFAHTHANNQGAMVFL